MALLDGENKLTGVEIAIIGMAGRFPGARNINEFWNNLQNGVEGISFFSDEDVNQSLKASGKVKEPGFVRCNGGMLEDKAFFDAMFFGYTPREAEIMDPQMRIFHECAWEALEDAGYDYSSYDKLIGIYAGATSSSDWEEMTILSGKREEMGVFASTILVDRDFLSARIAYMLNLRGPALAVQTACSTSLVAVHMACQAILDGECDMALAGGVSISTWHNIGYTYQEGMILSPDGHCRAFDARANGTTRGDGAGIVVLKSLKDAIIHRDYIHAVIKGTAINNDGTIKAGFTAPSREGQTEVIRVALQVAEVEPESIGYIEAHGTGTTIGDPIEIEALTQAFAVETKGFCAIGSLKTNIGHLDAAAGVAGLIKTVLALKFKIIPPSLHYEKPNSKIDFANSPFYVNTVAQEWKRNSTPLRAGVSSFGIGGTNAHVILEEAPVMEQPSMAVQETGEEGKKREYRLMVLSAGTQSALEKMTGNLAEYLTGHPGINLADAAYTLQVGRRALPWRRMAVCSNTNQAIAALTASDPGLLQSFHTKIEDRPVIFMFPGQGSQYINMGQELYQTESVFREAMDRCFEILKSLMNCDIKEILYPGGCTDEVNEMNRASGRELHSPPHLAHRGAVPGQGVSGPGIASINQTEITQPLLFVFEYALATLLMHWGIHPYAMIGHSIGEYTAACLAGVFSLADALHLVALRGRMIQQMPPGSMLSISLPEDSIKPLLEEELSIAAVNTPSHCVVSGPHPAIARLGKKLTQRGNENRRLHTSHAFHSAMMDPIVDPFVDAIKAVKLNKPGLPYISNVTGTWITVEEASDPGYWGNHLRKTVCFTLGLKELLKNENAIFVEVGPGKNLSTFVRQHADKKPGQVVVNLVPHAKEKGITGDYHYLLNKIGQLWLYGKTLDWQQFYSQEKRNRIPLPTYPWEGQSYWINPASFKMSRESILTGSSQREKKNMAEWFYIPSWKRSAAINFKKGEKIPFTDVLIFVDETGLGTKLAAQLQQQGKSVIMVRAGSGFSRESDSRFVINPGESSHYKTLVEELRSLNRIPGCIIHLWGLTTPMTTPMTTPIAAGLTSGHNLREETAADRFSGAQLLGLYSQVYLLQALNQQPFFQENQFRITVIGNHLWDVAGNENLCPEKATVLGAIKVIPQEYSNVYYRCIDIMLPEPGDNREQQLIGQLLGEISRESTDTVVAYRNGRRWVQTVEPLPWEEQEIENSAILKERGVYLITGGLGGIGLVLAAYLARKVQARLILTGRSQFPAQAEWEEWLSRHEESEPISRKIRTLKEIEAAGGEVLICRADTADCSQMQEVLYICREKFGPLNGIIHAAGIPREKSGQCPANLISVQDCQEQFKSKVYGLLVLETLLKGEHLDFCLLMSSLSTILGGLGFTAYAAANCFMDAFARKQDRIDGQRWITVDWDGWRLQGEDELSILSREGEAALSYILAGHGENHLVVSTSDLQQRIRQWVELPALHTREQAPDNDIDTRENDSLNFKARPNLTTPYEAPGSPLEKTVARIWENFFGFKELGSHDDFFELGGDSLKMMTLVSMIHKALKVEIPLVEFFNFSTIKGIARYISDFKASKEFVSINVAEKKEFYPLSSAQLRLYIIQQMEEHSIGYNLLQAVILEGDLRRVRFEQAFQELIRRHEVLRISMQLVNDEPVQRIHHQVPFLPEYYDAAGSSSEVKKILADFIRPFDLKRPPFFRVGLIRVSENNHILAIDIHHLITDGISNRIFINDLFALYEGETLSPLRLQYTDYSEWGNSREIRENLKKQEIYWLNEFAGEIPVLNMPLDFPRPEKRNFQGDEITVNLGKELNTGLNQLAKETGGTIYMILLSVFTILISKYSRQEDIVVGTPILGRRHSDLQDIMGVFVNILAMRNRPDPGKTFRELVNEVKENTLRAYENQDYPFDRLVTGLGQQGSMNRNPLFDILFQLNPEEIKVGKDTTSHSSLAVKSYSLEVEKRCVFDMVLFAVETGEDINLSLRYSIALFKRARCEKMITHFIEIINQVVRDCDVPLRDISISHQLLRTKSRLLEDNQADFTF